jgi:hypothetical protein
MLQIATVVDLVQFLFDAARFSLITSIGLVIFGSRLGSRLRQVSEGELGMADDKAIEEPVTIRHAPMVF